MQVSARCLSQDHAAHVRQPRGTRLPFSPSRASLPSRNAEEWHARRMLCCHQVVPPPSASFSGSSVAREVAQHANNARHYAEAAVERW